MARRARFLLAVLLTTLLLAGCGGQEQAQDSSQKEETEASEPTTEPKAQEVAERTYESFEEQEERQKPTAPDERIRYILQKEMGKNSVDEQGNDVLGDDVDVFIQPGQNGCRQVTTNYWTTGPTSIETEMRSAYEAVYGDARIRQVTCSLTVNAYGTLHDRYGQSSTQRFYTTHI